MVAYQNTKGSWKYIVVDNNLPHNYKCNIDKNN